MSNTHFSNDDYPTHDTDWAPSAKGNEWRRIDGLILVAGRNKGTGKYWAMCDGAFANGSFSSMWDAMHAAEDLFEARSKKQRGWR